MTTRIPRPCTAISPPHSPKAAEAPSQAHGNAAKAMNIIQAARALLNAEVQDYVAICDENTDLVARNKTLEEDVLSGNRRIASLQNKLDNAVRKFGTTDTELKKLLNEKEALAGQLTKAQETIREKQTEILRRDAESAKEAQTLRKQLDDERAKLEELQDFSIELMPVAKRHEQIDAKLSKMFSLARKLAEDYFAVDLSPGIMSNSVLWTNIKKHPAVNKNIPLPLSDTPTAKQMRAAAFLAVLAHEMRRHIFQPTYLLRDNTGLHKILDDLVEAGDNEREAHLRSVILRLSECHPKAADAVATAHIDAAMSSVSDSVLGLIPDESKNDFEANLHSFCTEACEHWRFIQRLDGKIDLDFDADEARPLFPPVPESTPSKSKNPPPMMVRPNGTNPSPNSKSNNAKKPNTTADPQTPAETLTDAVVVWPSFYNASTPAMETLVQGYLLTASQVAVAKSEEKAQQPTGPRRTQRMQSRTSRAMSMSMGENGSLENGTGVATSSERGSRNGGFLSQESGGGRKGA
ncbi:hypothetical protein MFIFM68171_02215 [Madurella fahalii]|uniref:MEI5 protein n=1 Tax=Madurella fahalii TaxID=1157608 RepID=A0ABQ0G2L0_9PEZI